MSLSFNKAFWDNRYLMDQTGWDLGEVSPPLKGYFNQLKDKSVRILIPGCGNAYEAAWLMEMGFENVTLVDISGILVNELKRKLVQYDGQRVHIIEGNFFDLCGEFDLIIEQTFFCALHPSFRRQYSNKMFELLAPGGRLAGLLFNREFESGPPFGGSLYEYRELFFPQWEIKTLAPCYNSIIPRTGSELFFIFQKPK
ncbi:MAG: methyltransferase domain-containing protein [Ferruginibacter sp.]|nr:methyltransferase domain-containing protein [Bacteroidota bacterium]MCW5917202.1 methyltransferase domain-containing protein [Ferruginibacter sp.]